MSRVLQLWEGMTGTLLAFSGASAPDGWLLCHGQAVSRADYAGLFAAIGTTYGAGNGSTTFNLPDIRGRVIAGIDNMGGTPANRLTAAGSFAATTPGAAGGSQTHTLTEAQMPAHSHTGSTAEAGEHTHSLGALMGSGNFSFNGETPGGSGSSTASSKTSGSAGAHTHDVSVSDTGGGQAHPSVQPTIALNYIIKT